MRRFLMPREHGAYAQLTFPLLSGLIVGGPSASGFLLAAGAVSLFLWYEPVVVLLGIRGVRLQREEGEVARRQLAVLVPAGVLLGLMALVLAEPFARLLVLVPAGVCALLLPLVPARLVKSLAGETLVAGALASMHLPLAAMGGARGVALWGPALVWFVGFVLATLAVHAIKARQKQREDWVRAAAVVSPLAAVAGAVTVAATVPELRLLALVLLLPLAAVILVNVARVHPRALKRVGWTLVLADTATLVLLAFL